MTSLIDTGDTVIHAPTGEAWTVACVENGRLSWCGWPEGTASLADCTLVRKAIPESRLELLKEIAAIGTSDHRQRYAAERLKSEVEK